DRRLARRFTRAPSRAGRLFGRAARCRLISEQPGAYRNSCAPQEIAARQGPMRRGFPRLVLFPFHGSLLRIAWTRYCEQQTFRSADACVNERRLETQFKSAII